MMFNPSLEEKDFDKMHKYGLEISKPNSVEVFINMYDGDIKTSRYLMKLHIFMWPPSVFEKTFADAGFVDFQWVRMHLEPDPSGGDKHLFHKDFADYAALIMFTAKRPQHN